MGIKFLPSKFADSTSPNKLRPDLRESDDKVRANLSKLAKSIPGEELQKIYDTASEITKKTLELGCLQNSGTGSSSLLDLLPKFMPELATSSPNITYQFFEELNRQLFKDAGKTALLTALAASSITDSQADKQSQYQELGFFNNIPRISLALRGCAPQAQKKLSIYSKIFQTSTEKRLMNVIKISKSKYIVNKDS